MYSCVIQILDEGQYNDLWQKKSLIIWQYNTILKIASIRSTTFQNFKIPIFSIIETPNLCLHVTVVDPRPHTPKF